MYSVTWGRATIENNILHFDSDEKILLSKNVFCFSTYFYSQSNSIRILGRVLHYHQLNINLRSFVAIMGLLHTGQVSIYLCFEMFIRLYYIYIGTISFNINFYSSNKIIKKKNERTYKKYT